MRYRTVLSGCLAPLSATLLLAPPTAAQDERDPLLSEPLRTIRAERLNLDLDPARRVGPVPVTAHSRTWSSADRSVVGIAQPATVVYRHDDEDYEFDEFFVLVDDDTGETLHEMETAQRFRLGASGTVAYAVACLGRSPDDTSSDASFKLNVYRGAGTTPAALIAGYDVSAQIERPGVWECFRIEGAVAGLELDAGPVWVAVAWRRATPEANTKLMTGGGSGSGGARAFRARAGDEARWEDWEADNRPGVYGIRLAVDHADTAPPDPPDDPDDGRPEEQGYTDCLPETTPLVFDGGFRVSMCYETPDGRVGDAKAGIWASGESGLLWFFNRDNAEVLVKVLNGCSFNSHRWVYIAPVTDLAFNLHIRSSDGRRWSLRNRQGNTASSRSDNRAFPCD